MAGTTVNWNDDSERNHEILFRFEKDFHEGKNPQVKDYLQGEGASRWKLLAELLHSNLELRIRAGQSLRALDYLQQHPELAQHPHELASLLKTEIRCLRQMGIQPILQKYQADYHSILGKNVEQLFVEENRATREAWIGSVIASKYKLLAVLGEGGMGSVYAAEQTQPVRRNVAVKLIKPGMDSSGVLARFEAERQALAMMDHPNIARMLDGGITEDGQPYFVMEHVKGLPITKFCDQEKMPLDDRLKLFMEVCHGVQHAHQKGIIHRDLKPSNILVTLIDGKPVPKVIDFGVAKALHQKLTDKTMYTEAGRMVGTLEYMAPEQADLNNLDVDTRADVYAMGVVLYELLTGQVPFAGKELRSAAYDEMLRIIREMEPPRPSTKLSSSLDLPKVAAQRQVDPKQLTSVVAGELDWIVMKCLEKERGRRYETANALGRELGRYLADEPVEARPPSVGYRLGKFVRRNRGKVAAAGILFITLTGGVAGTTWGLFEAREAQKKESAERARADLRTIDLSKEKERADEKASEAEKERIKADERTKEAIESLDRIAISEGLRLADSGDLSSAVAWLSKPLFGIDLAHDKSKSHHLQRLTNYLKHCFYCTDVGTDGHGIDWYSGNVTVPPFDVRTFTAKEFRDGASFATFDRAVTSENEKNESLPKSLRHIKNVDFIILDRESRYALINRGTVSNPIDLRVWSVQTGEPLSPAFKHSSFFTYGAFSPNGDIVVTASNNNCACIWDSVTGRQLTEPLRHEAIVTHASFSPDGRWLITGSADKTARIWDVRNGQPVSSPLRHGHQVNRVAFTKDGSVAITSSGELGNMSSIMTWNLIPQVWPQVLRLPIQSLHAAFAKGDQDLVTTDIEGNAQLWQMDQSGSYKSRQLGKKTSHYAVFSRDNKNVFTSKYSSDNNSVMIWDTQSCHLEKTIALSAKGPTTISLSQNGLYLLSCIRTEPYGPEKKAVIELWDTTSKKRVETISIDGDLLTAQISNDKNELLTITMDDRNNMTATIHHLPINKKRIITINNINTMQSVRGAVISSNGKLLAIYSGTNGGAGECRVWDLKTGRPISSPMSHTKAIVSVCFSADASKLAVASGEYARVWHVDSGLPLTPPLRHSEVVASVAFNSTDDKLITASYDKTVRIWDISEGNITSNYAVDWAALIANFRLDNGGGKQFMSSDEYVRVLKSLRKSSHQFYSRTLQQIVNWRNGRISDCINTGQVDSALHHHYWLIADVVNGSDKGHSALKGILTSSVDDIPDRSDDLLLGKWIVTETYSYATKEEAKEMDISEIAFDKDRMTMSNGKKTMSINYRTNPDKTPHQLDIARDEDRECIYYMPSGIYEITSDKLTICLLGGQGPRPDSFNPNGSPNWIRIKLKRKP